VVLPWLAPCAFPTESLTLLVRGYGDVQRAMAAILLEADEIIVKPFEAGRFAELLDEKISTRKPAARPDKKRVAPVFTVAPTISSKTGAGGISLASVFRKIRFEPAVDASQPQFFTDDLSCSDAKDPHLSFSILPSVSRARSIGNAVNARTLSFF